MVGLDVLLVVALIIATAFFVATEFAIIRVRSSRVDQLVQEGKKDALAVQKVTNNIDEYLSACQLGITITALGLGWLGKPTIESLLSPIFSSFQLASNIESLISFLIAFSLITFLHVVVGELAPKTLAIQKAEQVSLLFARPIIIFYHIMYPFIWLLNGSAGWIIRLIGLKPAKEHEEAHSESELRIILTESYESGKINQSEYGYVSRIFAFDDLLAREIMVPRTDMVCLDINHTLEENLKIIKSEQFTRFPVAAGNKDNIIGMINTKEFFLRLSDHPGLDFASLVHPVYTISEATAIKTLLKDMQKKRVHIALLLDEYGGTSGMVTIEDILEEIVGEIRDEFDAEEKMEIEKVNDAHIIVDGKVSISQINDLLDADIESENLSTIGGWLYRQNPIIKVNVEWSYHDLTFIVREKDNHRIRKVEIMKSFA